MKNEELRYPLARMIEFWHKTVNIYNHLPGAFAQAVHITTERMA